MENPTLEQGIVIFVDAIACLYLYVMFRLALRDKRLLILAFLSDAKEPLQVGDMVRRSNGNLRHMYIQGLLRELCNECLIEELEPHNSVPDNALAVRYKITRRGKAYFGKHIARFW